ncbi:MAG: class 1 fructose-bisphosphatase [Devosiaceae bacterium]|nr:class 1 fructose-bisphosphatase [Devosiaceae bacterium MH13]
MDTVRLPGDVDSFTGCGGESMGVFLARWSGEDAQRQALAGLVEAITYAAVPLAHRLAFGRLPGDPAAPLGSNLSGDRQKAIDIGAHDHYVRVLRAQRMARLLSEEADAIEELDPQGAFDVAMDPIDGSGSIGIGAPLGVLFCVFPAQGSFTSRSGREIVAAGYVLFGHTIEAGFSVGDGTAIADLNPETGIFHMDEPRVRVPEETVTIAFNAAKAWRWTPGLQRYVSDAMAGPNGPRVREFNMRWVASAVADVHRILRRGGVFLYPADSRPGHENGFLRLAYEAFPIAYLMEQAGAAATDGQNAILDLVPAEPHARTPLAFGSRKEIETLQSYL